MEKETTIGDMRVVARTHRSNEGVIKKRYLVQCRIRWFLFFHRWAYMLDDDNDPMMFQTEWKAKRYMQDLINAYRHNVERRRGHIVIK